MKKLLYSSLIILILHTMLYAKTEVSGTINSDMNWTSVDSPYVVMGTLIVNSGVTLTINPDVIVKFRSQQGMDIRGHLEVNATEGHEAYFTAYTDDSVGGDTNEDNTTTTPAANYWSRINIENDASANIHHAVIRYGGYYSWVYGYGALNKVGDNGTLVMRDCNVTDNALAGVRLQNAHNSNQFERIFVTRSAPCFKADNASFDINDSTFSECARDGGIYALNGSDGNITNNVIEDSTNGVYLHSDSRADIRDNILRNNTGYGLWLNAANTQTFVESNTFDENNEQIRLNGRSIGQEIGTNTYSGAAKALINGSIDTNVTMRLTNLVYFTDGLTVNAGKTLTIDPDVIIKFKSQQGMDIKGHLEVNATAGHEAYFTAYTDDSVGGDSNEDNTTTSPAAEYWSRIGIADNGSATIRHAVIRYGGYYSWVYKYGALNKEGDNGILVMSDSNVTDNSKAGVRLHNAHNENKFERIFVARSGPCFMADNASFDINDSTFSECFNDGGIYALNGSDGNITNNVIEDSTNGIYLNSDSRADIINNTIRDNTIGIYLKDGGRANILNNTITGSDLGIKLDNNDLATIISGNILSSNIQLISLVNNAIGQYIGSNTYDKVLTAFIAGTIDDNITLRLTNLVYCVNAAVSVNAGKTLTINPDVIVKFKSQQGMDIRGHLEVNATEGHEVYFTAYTDDSVGGDTNEDNTTTTPAANYWSRIHITDNGSATIHYAVIRYGGYYSWVYGYGVLNKEGDNGTLVMSDSNVTDNDRAGVRVRNAHNANRLERIFVTRSNPCFLADNASFDINDSTFSECARDGGIYAINGSDGNITNNVLEESTNGIYLNSDSRADIRDNILRSNTGYGLWLNAANTQTLVESNTFDENNEQIRLNEGSIGQEIGTNIYSGAAKALINGNLNTNVTMRLTNLVYFTDGLRVRPGNTLTVDSDVVVKFKSQQGMDIQGHLEVNATAGHEAYFTAYTDDSVGGDTNEDNTTTTPAAYYWSRINIDNDASATIRHAVIRYGGYYSWVYGYGVLNKEGDNGTLVMSDSNVTDNAIAGLRLHNAHNENKFERIFVARSGPCFMADNASFDINDSTFSECFNDGGIYALNGSDGNITNNVIEDSTNGVYLKESAARIEHNTIQNNTAKGVYLYGDENNETILHNNFITSNKVGISCSYDAHPTIGGSEMLSNDIFLNTDYGVENVSSLDVDASYNWWGDDSGPYHSTLNPGGLGNAVSDHVVFSPFMTYSINRDGDGDGVADWTDNCPVAFNPGQENIDGDEYGDACDADNNDGPLGDVDGDGILNKDDMYPSDGPLGDWDGDGILNKDDLDDSDGPSLSESERHHTQGENNAGNRIPGKRVQDTQPYLENNCGQGNPCIQGTEDVDPNAQPDGDPGTYPDRPVCDPTIEYLEQGTDTCVAL